MSLSLFQRAAVGNRVNLILAERLAIEYGGEVTENITAKTATDFVGVLKRTSGVDLSLVGEAERVLARLDLTTGEKIIYWIVLLLTFGIYPHVTTNKVVTLLKQASPDTITNEDLKNLNRIIGEIKNRVNEIIFVEQVDAMFSVLGATKATITLANGSTFPVGTSVLEVVSEAKANSENVKGTFDAKKAAASPEEFAKQICSCFNWAAGTIAPKDGAEFAKDSKRLAVTLDAFGREIEFRKEEGIVANKKKAFEEKLVTVAYNRVVGDKNFSPQLGTSFKDILKSIEDISDNSKIGKRIFDAMNKIKGIIGLCLSEDSSKVSKFKGVHCKCIGGLLFRDVTVKDFLSQLIANDDGTSMPTGGKSLDVGKLELHKGATYADVLGVLNGMLSDSVFGLMDAGKVADVVGDPELVKINKLTRLLCEIRGEMLAEIAEKAPKLRLDLSKVEITENGNKKTGGKDWNLFHAVKFFRQDDKIKGTKASEGAYDENEEYKKAQTTLSAKKAAFESKIVYVERKKETEAGTAAS
ncbi:MAG: hypothetical protein LBB14_01430 [Puniceicoccales bacterium]|jgi:hypothetical protein|nr:hypothetical protein [Puniceicoccales bacterium]